MGSYLKISFIETLYRKRRKCQKIEKTGENHEKKRKTVIKPKKNTKKKRKSVKKTEKTREIRGKKRKESKTHRVPYEHNKNDVV